MSCLLELVLTVDPGADVREVTEAKVPQAVLRLSVHRWDFGPWSEATNGNVAGAVDRRQ